MPALNTTAFTVAFLLHRRPEALRYSQRGPTKRVGPTAGSPVFEWSSCIVAFVVFVELLLGAAEPRGLLEPAIGRDGFLLRFCFGWFNLGRLGLRRVGLRGFFLGRL